ncbi:MAG: DUF2332 domain-containing protein [Alphaproteobacteria bacterium]
MKDSPDMAATFRSWADTVESNSPLYGRLARWAAADSRCMALAAGTPRGQLAPNLLLAAVHDLLLSGVEAPLARYYPSLTPGRRGEAATEPGDPAVFLDFCASHEDALRQIIATRTVQTNEIQRLAVLLPAFMMLDMQYADEPVHYVEVGASAGFNLLWPWCGFSYGDGRIIGHAQSPVHLNCELRGGHIPVIAPRLPEAASRVGLDLNPVDIDDANQVRWLKALVWPDQPERMARLDGALALARRRRPEVRRGNALDLLPAHLAGLPDGAPACIFHSIAIYQMSLADRQYLSSILQTYSQDRPIYRVGLEHISSRQPLLELHVYADGERKAQALAYADFHGAWMEWQGG